MVKEVTTLKETAEGNRYDWQGQEAVNAEATLQKSSVYLFLEIL